MEHLNHNQNEGGAVGVFSGKQLAHLLKRRQMSPGEFYRLMVQDRPGQRKFKKSQALLYRWLNEQSEPRAGDISLMAHVLGCSKDDLYEEESRVD